MINKKGLYALLFLCGVVLLFGCKGQQWALKSQAIIHAKFPELEAQNCRERFVRVGDTVFGSPVITEEKKETPGPVLRANCDSAFLAAIAKWATANPGSDLPDIPVMPGAVDMQCPPSTETIKKVVVPAYIPMILTAPYEAEKLAHDKTKAESNEKTGKIQTLYWVLGGAVLIIVLLAAALYFTAKRKIKIP